MSATDDFIKLLRSTRPDYSEELARHKFHLDAYSGMGGFKGTTKVEAAGYWGPGAEVYAGIFGLSGDQLRGGKDPELDSYIDRFPREDSDKYLRRTRLAHYENHVMPVVDIPLSYLNRKGMTREVPDAVEPWLLDADGSGTSWKQIIQEVCEERAAVVGYCPVLFDLPPVEEGMSIAQAQALGQKLRAIPLFPAHLLNWGTNREGKFEWVKVQIIEESIGIFGESQYLETITVWYENSCSIWRITKTADGADRLESTTPEEKPHSFGEVPIKVLRWKPVQGDPVRGLPMIENISDTSRRLFNYTSELDEHIRQAVFSMIQVPTTNPDGIGEMMVGNGNALPVHPDSSRDYKWLSPDMAVAEILQKQKDHARQEIYRMGRSEFTQTAGSTGGAAKSGLSRQYEFETANRAIADFAQRVAMFETKCLALVTRVMGGEAEALKVTAPTKFAVEEMLQELAEAQTAIDMDLGPTATRILKLRIADKLLSNLSEEDRDAIEKELMEAVKADARQDTLAGAFDEEVNADEDEDENEEEAEEETDQ